MTDFRALCAELTDTLDYWLKNSNLTDGDARDLVEEARAALAEEYEAEANNPPEGHPDPEPFQLTMRARAASLRAALAQPKPTELPPGYIDPEHTGADLHLLQVFYRACQFEGGTADEIHLRGIRAVLADAALAQPEPQGPTDQELLDLFGVVTPIRYIKVYKRELDFARAVLARWGRPATTGEQR
jgi:hypothetical protein